jgi:hypothetical protein
VAEKFKHDREEENNVKYNANSTYESAPVGPIKGYARGG